jgi:RimJ/RimL family protein N-acetyltransferase
MDRTIVRTGKYIALAEMTEADQSSFCVWLQDANLRAAIHDHRVPTIDDQMQWFLRVQQPDRQFFSIVTVPDHTLLGNAGFVEINPDASTAILRITIGNPDGRGKGFGTEAVTLLLQYGFMDRGWNRIFLHVLPQNEAAVRVYQKVGFVPSKDQPESDTLRMEISREQYISAHS